MIDILRLLENEFNYFFFLFTFAGNGDPIECCSEDATNPPPRWRHPACAPLIVDVAVEDYNRLPSCLNYVRSALGIEKDCKFGPAEQVREFHSAIVFIERIRIR